MRFIVYSVESRQIMGVSSSYLGKFSFETSILTNLHRKTREKHALCNIQMVSSAEVSNIEVF